MTPDSTVHALSVHLAIPRAKYPKDRDVANFMARILDRVRRCLEWWVREWSTGCPSSAALKTAASSSKASPGPPAASATPTGVPRRRATSTRSAFRLVAGRVFTEFDSENAKAVGLIDAATAARIWPGQSPLGKRFRIGVEGQPWVEIVGVVGPSATTASIPLRTRKSTGITGSALKIAWRWSFESRETRLNGSAPLSPQVRAVDPEQAVYNAFTVDEIIDRSLSQRRLNALLVSLFAAVSLLLAMVGIYGVMAYAVEQRVREFGIRMALGARPSDVIRRVVMRGAVLGIGGAILGLAATGLMARFLATLLFT